MQYFQTVLVLVHAFNLIFSAYCENKQFNVALSNGFYFVINVRAASVKDKKKDTLISIFLKLKPNITYPSKVLVAEMQDPLRTPRFTKYMLEKAPLNF